MVELALDQNPLERARRIEVNGVNALISNITAPFEYKGKTLIAARMQASKDKTSPSTICFLRQRDDSSFEIRSILPVIGMEDSSIAHIKGNLVFSCIKTHIKEDGDIGYRTYFYKNPDFDNFDLERDAFAVGPGGMKDIRLVDLGNDGVGIFTRPEGGEIAGKGKIGFTIIQNLDDLKDENIILSAPIIPGQFEDDGDNQLWGGVNAAYPLENGKIAILGHIASVDSKGKHYRAMTFVLDPKTRIASPMEIIATREDFPDNYSDISSEHDELFDVVFPGGLTFNNDGTITMYVGLSDASAAVIRLPMPNCFKV